MMHTRVTALTLLLTAWIAMLSFSALPAQAAPALLPKPQLATATPQPDGSIIHTVTENESPYSIAVDYDISVTELYSLNNLSEGATLNPGDLLVIRPAFTPTLTPEPSLTPTPVIPTATRRPTRTATLPPPPSNTPLPSATPTPQPLFKLPDTNTFMSRMLPVLAAVIGTTGIVLVIAGSLLKRRR